MHATNGGSVGITQATGDVTTPASSSGSTVFTIGALKVITAYINDLAVTTAKIADGAVTTAKHAANSATNAVLAQMAAHTFKGNNTGSTANALDLTAAQLTAELSVYTTLLQGEVPASVTNNHSKVLWDDGWGTAPAGGGGGATIPNTTSALAGDGAGNAVGVTGTGTNCVHVDGSSAACGGGSSTGFGVDGGASSQSVTGTATISNGTRLVKVATGWATGTLTLPAISAVSTDTCIRIEDGGNFIDGTHTLTLKGGTSDGLNGGAANGTIGAFTTAGMFLQACVSAANNWNVGPGSIAASTAPSHQFASGLNINGLAYTQPAVTDLSGFGTNVAAALGNTLSGASGLTSTIASGTSALGTSAIASATCATVVTTAATNTATTDVVTASFNGDPTAVTGYVPLTTGMLSIIAYPTANNVNFKVCNNTSASITPGAITLNWRVVR